MRGRIVYVVVAKSPVLDQIIAIDAVCATKERAEQIVQEMQAQALLYSDRMYWTYVPTLEEEE